jgi:hypothetical protein
VARPPCVSASANCMPSMYSAPPCRQTYTHIHSLCQQRFIESKVLSDGFLTSQCLMTVQRTTLQAYSHTACVSSASPKSHYSPGFLTLLCLMESQKLCQHTANTTPPAP